MDKNITHQTTEPKARANCNVSQTFNFTVGAIAIVVAIILGYVIYKYFIK